MCLFLVGNPIQNYLELREYYKASTELVFP